MVRTLLADRFKLSVHRDHQRSQVYTLTVASNGPKLQVVKEGQKNLINWTGPGSVTYTEVTTLKILVGTLGSLLGAPVVDETGLIGTYSFSLDFTHPRDP